MRTEDFDYTLPPELIAQTPIERRDLSGLLVLHRKDGKIEHRFFKDIIDYLNPGDLLVLNNTKVIKARLVGYKETGGKVKVLLLKAVDNKVWEVLVDVGRGLKSGRILIFGDELKAEVIEEPKEGGVATLKFFCKGNFEKILEKLGEIPLPPYIKNSKSQIPNSKQILNPKSQIPNLKQRYQTVYAKVPGATAAPTAGLHFTKELLNKIKAKGINIAYITLHTGYATFKPVVTENIEDHKMYKEYFEIGKETVKALGKAKRIIAVGTTTVRALETAIKAGKGETDLFIYPGYQFKIVDAMVTNFHLPRSTLLMLTSAFASHNLIMKAYKEAIKEGYRFYSFGDAMLIL